MKKWTAAFIGACMTGAALANVEIDQGIFSFSSKSNVKVINADLYLRADSTFRKVFQTISKVNPADTGTNIPMNYEIVEHRGKWIQSGSNLILTETQVSTSKITGRASDQMQLPANATETWTNTGTITIPIRNVSLETFQAQETSAGGWIVWERE